VHGKMREFTILSVLPWMIFSELELIRGNQIEFITLLCVDSTHTITLKRVDLNSITFSRRITNKAE